MEQTNSMKEYLASSDQSIIAGLGLSSEFDLSLKTLNINGPTAASTAYALKSRDQMIEKLLSQQRNTRSTNFRVPVSELLINVDNLVDAISPPKTLQERIIAAKLRPPKNAVENDLSPVKQNSRAASSSFINVNDMSGLSTNSFLVTSLENKTENADDNFVLGYNKLEDNGLPSILIDGVKNSSQISTYEEDPWKSTATLKAKMYTGQNHDRLSFPKSDDWEDSMLGKEIEHSLDQFSSRSTFFQKSKLLSSSCNSLGSLGKDENANCSLSSVSQLGEQSLDSFLTNQCDLADFVDGEEFKAINVKQFEKEEEQFKRENKFNKDYTFSSEHSYAPDLSGFHSSSHNITVRASWLSDLKDFKAGDKINMEQLFKAKSCNMGSFNNGSAEKISFGLGTESPPKEIAEEPISFQNSSSDKECLHDKQSLDNSFSLPPSKDLSNPCTQSTDFYLRGSGDGSEKTPDENLLPKINFNQQAPTINVESLGDLHSSIGSELFKKLLLEASKTDDAEKMLDNVLKLIKGGAIKTLADESSISDTSYEVLELRKVKEKAFADICGSAKTFHGESDKENMDDYSSGDKFSIKNFDGEVSCYNSSGCEMMMTSNNQQHKHKQLNIYSQCSVLGENQSQNINNSNFSVNKMTPVCSPKRQARFRMGTSSLRNNGKSFIADLDPDPTARLKSGSIEPLNAHLLKNYNSADADEVIPIKYRNQHTCEKDSTHAINSDVSDIQIDTSCEREISIPSKVHFPDTCLTNLKSETSISIDNPTDNFIKISAKDLKVGVTCDGSSTIDFGIVAESCLVSKRVGIINQSNYSYPVILSLQQEVETTTEVLYWSESNSIKLKLLSPTLAACELPPSSEPVCVTVFFKAPTLENFTDESRCLIVNVFSKLFVAIDCPVGSPMILNETPIKIQVGEVRLRTVKNEIPFLLKASTNEMVTSQFCLKNESSFPLTICARMLDSSEVFSVSPSSSVIEPDTKANLKVSFNPSIIAEGNNIERLLKVSVEPEGMEFDVPIMGIVAMSTVPVASSSKIHIDSFPVFGKEKGRATHQLSNQHEKSQHSIHLTSSQPILEKINRTLSLDCSKSRIIFGTVQVGLVQSQNLVLYNNWPDKELILNIALVGCKNLEFALNDTTNIEKSKSRELTIAPNSEISLNIHFEPSDISSYAASIICKPKGLIKQVKMTIPVQGFGGSGNLAFGKCDEIINSISLGEISPGNPAIANTTVRNTGERAIFIKLLALLDEKSDERFSSLDMKIYPADFVLLPGESREILLVAIGTPLLMAKAPGKVGVFQAIFGDEILRSRFRSLKSRKVKNSKIKDLSVLNVNWDTTFVSEKDINEKNDLPPQPEDALLFLNGCIKKKISVDADIDHDSEVSSSRFSILQQEETCTSFIQSYLDETSMISSSLPHKLLKEVNERMLKSAAESSSNAVQDFKSYPTDLKFSSSSLEQNVTVVNYSNCDQHIEVACKEPWLTVEPSEAILLSSRFSMLCFKIQISQLPSPQPRILKTMVQILGENCRSIVFATLDLGDEHLSFRGHKAPSQQFQISQSRSTTNSLSYAQTATNSIDKRGVTANDKGRPSSTSEVSYGRNRDTIRNASKESRVELVTASLEFPTILVKSQAALRLNLKNLDKVPHQINAKLQSEHFFIRHTSFEIKPCFHVNLPVFFTPQSQGNFSAKLLITVAEDGKQLQAALNGNAV